MFMMENKISISTKVELNNGVEMPILGLGVWQIDSGKTEAAVLYAFKAGYRLLDTAKIYGNEEAVGKALDKSGIPREEVFITTKLWNSDHGYESAIAACERSLKRLGLSYIDLYLIHWPVTGLRNETWRAMETLLEEGKCRAIGVSNYMIRHLEELLDSSSTIPAVNQVEFSPYLYQKELLGFCSSHGIQLEAYSPLTRGLKLRDPRLVSIARKYHKSTAQILIRWALQRSVVAIPKSSKEKHIHDNANVFDFTISPEDMNVLDSLDDNLRIGWNPSTVE
jgi:diketogulonate reductase-like aldo/keto reductase